MQEISLTDDRRSLVGEAFRSKSFSLGFLLTGAFIVAAVLSLVWTPYDATAISVAEKLRGPSAAHWLGTDHFGRDILSMIMVGARTSIAVAFVSVGIGIVAGVPLGLWAAARQGSLVDEIIMRANDLVFAFPALLIAILITAVFGPGAVNAIIAIGIFNIPVFARLARGALTLWTRNISLRPVLPARAQCAFRLSTFCPTS